ncbi:MAG: glycosyltransferase family 4 protein [Synergistaceae bacterium]|nr:glycosyltransferase family 4 protein [Synergistaceae bacterium]
MSSQPGIRAKSSNRSTTDEMKILHIVPEFEEGGVERYVVQLCHEQTKRGHEIFLATAGGKLEKFLPESLRVLKLPVQRKNLFTVLYSVHKLSRLRGLDIIHAHSRVPAWIAWLLSSKTKTKWIMTAHAPYSLNFGIKPLKHADGVICVSDAVRSALENFLPPNTITIPNGVRAPEYKWQGKYFPENKKFLYVGYLAKRKGVDVALKALGLLKDYEWSLDVLGNGSHRVELENLSRELGLDDRVKFWGFRDDAEKFMSEAACLLFPSRQEGLPLTVNEALAVGLPVIASDIEPLRPLATGALVPVDDVEAWRDAILKVIEGGAASPLSMKKLTSFHETAQKVEEFYKGVC